MAGRGPAPDPQRVRRGKPVRGDWSPSPEGGWQHPIPEPPPGLTAHSVTVWEDWFRAWWAGNWTTDDLPTLRLTIRLYDRVMRGDVKRLGELRQWMDSLGITPKGRQDRRWVQPPVSRPMTSLERIRAGRPGVYDHLRGQDPQTRRDRLAALDPGAHQESASERFRRLQEAEDPADRFARIEAGRHDPDDD